jgi:hypothetical protein
MQSKRCAIWRVDPQTRTATWALDLPSRGDTCFPEAVPTDDPNRWILYNYSSDVDGYDWGWLDGQMRPTFVYRMDLVFP